MKKISILLITLFSVMTLTMSAATGTSRKINIVYIGNSITQAYYLSRTPPAISVQKLEASGYVVKYVNSAVSGSTSVDFLPERNNLFPKVTKAADSLNDSDALLLFSITLGTNDSAETGPTGAPVSSRQYKKNLATIIDSLIARYPECKIILNRPTWYSPNTHNSSVYLQAGLDRLQTYFVEIKNLISEKSGHVYEGDTEAFDFFKENYLQYLMPENGNSGTFYLHPNQEGAEKLADFWTKSLKKNLKEWGYDLETGRKRVICVGNSITENTALNSEDKYPAILQRFIGDGFFVTNLGASGHTLLKKGDFPYWNSDKYTTALNSEPDIVVIELGTNDAKPGNWIYKGEFVQDYIDFVNSFKNLPTHPQIYICYPLPAYQDNWLPVKDETFTQEMMPMLDSVARTTGATIIDLHTPLLGHVNFVYDKVHPNAKGTTYMAYIIGNVICPTCEIPALPDNFFQQMASFDFTDKSSEISSSVIDADLTPLTDNDGSTGIRVASVPQVWFSVSLPEEIKATGYTLTSGKGSPDDTPKSWKFQGSVTGRVWYNIDLQENQIFDNMETKVYEVPYTSIDNLASYKYYRILFTANNGGDSLQLNEWQVFGFNKDMKVDITNNGGTITGEYEGYPGEKIENLIDNKLTTKYCVVDKNGGWMQYDSPVKISVGKYALTSCVDLYERNLRAWQLLGSNDGVQWDVIDTRSDQDFVVKFSTMEYDVNSTKEYSKLRLNILKINSSTTFQIAEWQLFKREISSIVEPSVKNNIYALDGKIFIESERDFGQYRIYDVLGRCLYSGAIGSSLHIVENCARGLYYVHVYDKNGGSITKLIL